MGDQSDGVISAKALQLALGFLDDHCRSQLHLSHDGVFESFQGASSRLEGRYPPTIRFIHRICARIYGVLLIFSAVWARNRIPGKHSKSACVVMVLGMCNTFKMATAFFAKETSR